MSKIRIEIEADDWNYSRTIENKKHTLKTAVYTAVNDKLSYYYNDWKIKEIPTDDILKETDNPATNPEPS